MSEIQLKTEPSSQDYSARSLDASNRLLPGSGDGWSPSEQQNYSRSTLNNILSSASEVKAGTIPDIQLYSTIAGDFEKGVVNAITDHPFSLAANMAIGAASGALATALSRNALIAVTVYGIGNRAYELYKHFVGWVHDIDVLKRPEAFSLQEREKSHKDIEDIGAGTLFLITGTASGVAAGMYKTARSGVGVKAYLDFKKMHGQMFSEQAQYSEGDMR
jgi:hypothetical protein